MDAVQVVSRARLDWLALVAVAGALATRPPREPEPADPLASGVGIRRQLDVTVVVKHDNEPQCAAFDEYTTITLRRIGAISTFPVEVDCGLVPVLRLDHPYHVWIDEPRGRDEAGRFEDIHR
jgi:hypothetical protein